MSELSPLELLHGPHSETDAPTAAVASADPLSMLSEAEQQSIAAAKRVNPVPVPFDSSVPPAEEPYLDVDYVGPPVGADNAPL